MLRPVVIVDTSSNKDASSQASSGKSSLRVIKVKDNERQKFSNVFVMEGDFHDVEEIISRLNIDHAFSVNIFTGQFVQQHYNSVKVTLTLPNPNPSPNINPNT